MKYLSIFLFMVLAKGAFAQNTPTSMDLRACIEYALTNNINVQQSQASVDNSLNTLNISKAARLPSLNGMLGGNGNTGRNVDPFTNGIVTQTIGTANMGVGLSLPIYQGGRLKNAIERDQNFLEASHLDVVAQQNNIAIQVTTAYLNVLSAEDMIEVSQKQLDVTQLQYERTFKMVKEGALPETNLYDFEAQRANDELTLINAENTRESAFLSLKRTMNAPSEMMFEVVRTAVPDPALMGVDASLGDIYNTAFGFLPEIKAGEIRMRAADINLAIARSVGQPSISLSSNWGTAFSSVARQEIRLPARRRFRFLPSFRGKPFPLYLTCLRPVLPIVIFRSLNS